MRKYLVRTITTVLIASVLLAGAGTAEAQSTSCNPWKVAEYFGTYEGGPEKFKRKHDLNDDGVVTVGDIILAAICWEERHTPR